MLCTVSFHSQILINAINHCCVLLDGELRKGIFPKRFLQRQTANFLKHPIFYTSSIHSELQKLLLKVVAHFKVHSVSKLFKCDYIIVSHPSCNIFVIFRNIYENWHHMVVPEDYLIIRLPLRSSLISFASMNALTTKNNSVRSHIIYEIWYF